MKSEIEPEFIKILVPTLSWSPLVIPWVVLWSLGVLLEISGAIWWRFLAKLGRRWSQDGHKMGQVGSKLRPRWAVLSLAAFGTVLGAFWVTFLAIFGKMAEV